MKNICTFNEIRGMELPTLPSDLTFFVDLIYFDGPLLSLFKDKNGNGYIFYWCDVDENYNRWIIFRADKSKLKSYIHKKITLKDMVLNPVDGFLYIADVDDDIHYQNIQVVHPDELPESYVPKKNSYYDPESELDEESESKVLDFLEVYRTYHVKTNPKPVFVPEFKTGFYHNKTGFYHNKTGFYLKQIDEADDNKYQTAA